MSVRRPFDNDYEEFKNYSNPDSEEDVNETSTRSPYNNDTNRPTEFPDAYNMQNEISTNITQRVAGYDNSKKFSAIMEEEIAKTSVENSEMYQGLKLTDDFLEATAGALSTKAYADHEDRIFERLQNDIISNDVNASIKNIMGEELGSNYYINLTEDYTSSFDGIFKSFEMKNGELQVEQQFTLSTSDYEKALRGGQVEIRMSDGSLMNVNSDKWIIKDENMFETTLQEKLASYSKVRDRNDLIRNEAKKLTNVMEHMGIHNVNRLSDRELRALIRNSTNNDVKVIASTLLDMRNTENAMRATSRSAKRTNRARGGFFKQKMLGDCEMMNGMQMTATSIRVGKKITKGSLTVAHRLTTNAAHTATFIVKGTGRVINSAATRAGISSLQGYQKVYNAASNVGNVMDGVVKGYGELPDTIKETKEAIKRDVKNEVDALRAGKHERKYKRRETIRNLNNRTRVGRKINRGMDRLGILRSRVSNKLNPVRTVFHRIGNAFGAVGKVIRAPFGLAGKIRSAAIKVILSAAGVFLKIMAIIIVAELIFSTILGVLCTVTSFGQKDGDLSIGQVAVNKLRAQGGEFVKTATDIKRLNDEITVVSGRVDEYGNPFKVTLDDSISCVYEGTDGTPITSTDFYNIKQILTTAEIHFHGDYSKESYYEYTRELWEATHSYYVEYSDVFYCDDKENCDNWHEFYHTSDYLDVCDNVQTHTDVEDEEVEYEECGGHDICGGHVKVIIHLVAERGVEELTPHAAELSSHMSYVQGVGWLPGTDEIDYYNDTYYAELYDVLMGIDWQKEYGISLSAGTFDASSITIDGENDQAVHDFLIGCGYSEAGAAGIMGNLQTESPGFNASVSGSTVGIAQWMGNRQTALFNFCANDGLDPYSLEGQLNFLYYELSTGYPHVHAAMMSATDPVEAACYFCAHYECCYILTSGTVQTEHYGDPDYYYYRSKKYQYWQSLPLRKSHAIDFYITFAGY